MFGSRIKELRVALSFSQETLAEKLGVSRRTISGWEADDSSPNTVQLFALSELGFDVGYIITGKSSDSRSDGFEEFAKIPAYDVEVSAGNGAFFNDENIECYMAYRKAWLKSRNLNVDNLSVVMVRGDSMQPTLNDKEYILIDHATITPKDGIYVVRSGDTLWVKRLQRMPNNQILLISDNTHYPPITVDLRDENFQIIGRVVNSSRNFY